MPLLGLSPGDIDGVDQSKNGIHDNLTLVMDSNPYLFLLSSKTFGIASLNIEHVFDVPSEPTHLGLPHSKGVNQW